MKHDPHVVLFISDRMSQARILRDRLTANLNRMHIGQHTNCSEVIILEDLRVTIKFIDNSRNIMLCGETFNQVYTHRPLVLAELEHVAPYVQPGDIQSTIRCFNAPSVPRHFLDFLKRRNQAICSSVRRSGNGVTATRVSRGAKNFGWV